MKARIMIKVLTALSVMAGLGVVHGQQQGQTPSTKEQKMAAFKDALKSGAITQEEYDAKVARLSSSGPGPQIAWTTVSVIEPLFKMPAFTVTIPADWSFEGAVLRGSCGDDLPMMVYRASSPDGLTGVQAMPRVDWYYAQDPRALQMAGVGACNPHPPVSAAKQAADIASKVRPEPQIGPVEPMAAPGLVDFARKTNKLFEDQARQFGRPNDAGRVTVDSQRVRIQYNFEGHPVEEWIGVQTMVWDQGVTVMGTGANGIITAGMARLQHTQTFVVGRRAPQGSLDSAEPLLKAIQAKPVPEYDQAYSAFLRQQFDQVTASRNAAFANTLKQGELAHEALMNQNRQYQQNQASLRAQHSAYMAWQQQRRDANHRQFQADISRKNSQNKNFVDYVSDQQYYLNPETGATVTVQNVPGANGVVTRSSWGNWVQLVPISH